MNLKRRLNKCMRTVTISSFRTASVSSTVIHLQVLQMRKTKESVLIYRFQIVSCEEAVERSLIFHYSCSQKEDNRLLSHIRRCVLRHKRTCDGNPSAFFSSDSNPSTSKKGINVISGSLQLHVCFEGCNYSTPWNRSQRDSLFQKEGFPCDQRFDAQYAQIYCRSRLGWMPSK